MNHISNELKPALSSGSKNVLTTVCLRIFSPSFVLFPHLSLSDYRALYCPAPSSPLLAIYGMIDGGEVTNLKILLLS